MSRINVKADKIAIIGKLSTLSSSFVEAQILVFRLTFTCALFVECYLSVKQ